MSAYSILSTCYAKSLFANFLIIGLRPSLVCAQVDQESPAESIEKSMAKSAFEKLQVSIYQHHVVQ